MKLFTAAQIREWDKFTINEEQITPVELMERAATTCFKWIKKNIPITKHMFICCGSGNNGGDGLVIARLLFEAKFTVSIYILNNKKTSAEFAINLDKLISSKVDLFYVNTLKELPIFSKNMVIIDALFGTGIDRPLKTIAAQFVHHINKSGLPVISIDIPSGLFADSFSANKAIVKATHTLTFQSKKITFLLPENIMYTGEVHVMDIELSKKFYAEEAVLFETIDKQMIKNIYKPRNSISHKYNFGHALLYAGSKNMMGAAVLCAKSCMRSGTGLVTIQVTPDCEAIVHISIPEVITNSEKAINKTWLKKSAIAVGPGLENSTVNKQLLHTLLRDWQGPLVIDATALSLLITLKKLLPNRTVHSAILCPHTGEFEKLFGKTTDSFQRLQLAIDNAVKLKCFVILKGPNTLIACPDGKHYFNTTGNAGMATAGSGDALTGILCGLLAQGYSEKEACILGVYLHGLAGDIAAKKLSQEAMIATDIIDCLGNAFLKIHRY